MRKVDWNNVPDAGERIVPGGYIARIKAVKDVEEKEYLRIEYDIADGPYKGYFSDMYDRFKMEWFPGSFIKSYKETALSFFKQFKTAVEESNRNYRFDEGNLEGLVGKYLGVVLGEEEYLKKNGEIGVRIYVDQCRSGKAIKDGDYTVPDKKFLKPEKAVSTTAFTALDDEDDGDLPF